MMKPDQFQTSGLLERTGATGDLTDREKHLIGIAVSATRGCAYCTGRRIDKALGEGVEQATVRAAIDLAAAINAGIVLRTAVAGAEAHAGAGA